MEQKSWTRRTEQMRKRPSSWEFNQQQEHHQKMENVEMLSCRSQDDSFEDGIHIGIGNSVPETHSEISTPLRHNHSEQQHVYCTQVGPLLDQVNGNVVAYEQVEICEQCLGSTLRKSFLKAPSSDRVQRTEQLSSEQGEEEEWEWDDGYSLSTKFSFLEESVSDPSCFSETCEACSSVTCNFTTNFSKLLHFRQKFGLIKQKHQSLKQGESCQERNSSGNGYNCRRKIDKKMKCEMSEKGINRGNNMQKTSGRQDGGGGTRRVFGNRNLWIIMYAFLLVLSVFQRADSLSVLDDDDDDEFAGISSYSHSVYSRSRRSAESFSTLSDALDLIPSNYSIHEPPPTNNSEATQVDFSVLIMNVRDIKELNEELSLEMNLRIYWKDTRLSHLADRSGNKFIVLNPVLLDKLWHPDIFIDHVKGVAQPALISKPASLRVYPDSSVRYSARITVTMACQMDFHYYPADTQRCSVDIKSYAYSSKILALDWREGKGALLVEYLELPNFDVALDTTQNFMVNTSSGSYSGIRFTILLRRKLSYHLIQTYLPSTLFIIVSWLSFLVPPESVPGRMALCMTTLLTLTAMFSAVRQNTPNVSYVKALDIWMVVCIIFVFLTLVEYTVLLKLRSKKPKPKHPQTDIEPTSEQQPQQTRTRWTFPSVQYSSDDPNFKIHGCKNVEVVINENGTTAEMRHREVGNPVEANGGGGGDSIGHNIAPPSAQPQHVPSPPPPPTEKPLNKYELAAKKIEKFTSAVIPTLFVVFNFIYWPWLISESEYYATNEQTTIMKSM